jgi:endoglucanase
MLEVHCYDPWDFAGEGKGKWDESSWANKAYLSKQFGKLKTTFIDKGIPVIIGEYGAVGNNDPSRISYVEYITKTAVENGIVPIWWDNGALGVGREEFGLFNRKDNTVAGTKVIEAIMKAKK